MSSPAIQDASEGPILTIKASPGAARDDVRGIWNGMVRIRTSAAPDKGKANRRILSLLAELLGVPRSRLRILSGESARTKRIQVLAGERDELLRILAKLPETS